MRVVYLHQYFTTPQMSGGTRSYELALRLVAKGHDVHMITSDRDGSGQQYETIEDGIRVTWIPVRYSNQMSSIERIRAFLSFAIRSAQCAARSEADVIFATSTPLTIALPGVYAKWRQRVPMVFEVRDLWPEMPIALGVLTDPVSKRLARWLERFAYRNSEHIVALSPGMSEGIASTGYPESRISVIPNAADIERFSVAPDRGVAFRSRYPWLGNRKLVVYAGTLGQVNGVSYLVDIAAEMMGLDPEIRFLVVGSGKEEVDIRHYARRLDVLEQNFFMLPSVPKSEIPDILSAANICTSLFIDVREMWANSANKVFDALAAGRPLAINYGGWQNDLIQSAQCGITLPPADAHLAALSLRELLEDAPRLQEMGANARHLAVSQFSRDEGATHLIDVLERVANSTGNDRQKCQ